MENILSIPNANVRGTTVKLSALPEVFNLLHSHTYYEGRTESHEQQFFVK